MIIILSGPPKAGKSRLRGDLFVLLRASRPAREWFVEVASPDGEGQWVSDMGGGEEAQALARRFKAILKERGHFFSPEWLENKKRGIENLVQRFSILVIDLGGLPSRENRYLVEGIAEGIGTLPVVLLGPQGDGGWVEFWERINLSPLVVQYHEGLAKEVLTVVDQFGGT